jgi:periplasmic divalent cation tolerance protein
LEAGYRPLFLLGWSATLKQMEVRSDPVVVLMTAASAEEATRIAELLVNKKLAACVQILPDIQSIYVWKGEVLREKEVLLLAKTTRANFAELEREVRAIHSYETPEIIALPIAAGSEPYLKWLTSSCEGS